MKILEKTLIWEIIILHEQYLRRRDIENQFKILLVTNLRYY